MRTLLIYLLFTSSSTAMTASARPAHQPILSEAQFETLFPDRIPFYTYAGLIEATHAYPAFGNSGTATQRKQEVAAFLANVMHESHGLQAINEADTRNHDHYCNDKEGVACAPGKQYYGRGPIQLSWNFNYQLAGQSLSLDLLNDPDMVSRVPAVAWKTALWYWMTMKGPAEVPSHVAMQQSQGFGETVRSINGILECSQAPGASGYQQQQARIQNYLKSSKILGVKPGKHTPC